MGPKQANAHTCSPWEQGMHKANGDKGGQCTNIRPPGALHVRAQSGTKTLQGIQA